MAAAERVLRSGRVNYWTGNEGRLFEAEFAAAAGCHFGVALANGTLALELALRALEIGPGHEVITTARTFIASASCAATVGARPVLVDVDRASQNLTAATIAPAITARTRAVIAVHLNGWPCDMDPILELARRHDLAVIEDCAQAHGAAYKGRPVGSMGVMGAFSFCQDKIMTTGGEGGMITTNDARLHEAVWSLKDHGKSFAMAHSGGDPASSGDNKPGGRERIYERFGTNGRMTEMQAAIGRVQLRRVPEWVAQRRRNAAALARGLAGVPGLRLPEPPGNITHACYRFSAFIEPAMLRGGWSRDRIVAQIVAAGVPCFAWSNSEIGQEHAFSTLSPEHAREEWDAGLAAGAKERAREMTERETADPLKAETPVARELSETSLIFLVHPTLNETHMNAACEAIKRVMAEACS